MMSNSANIFQLDKLLKYTLEGSSLETYADIDASIKGETGKEVDPYISDLNAFF